MFKLILRGLSFGFVGDKETVILVTKYAAFGTLVTEVSTTILSCHPQTFS